MTLANPPLKRLINPDIVVILQHLSASSSRLPRPPLLLMASHARAEKVLEDQGTGIGEEPRERVQVPQIGRHARLRRVGPLRPDNCRGTVLGLHQRHHLLEPDDGLLAQTRVHHVRIHGGEFHSVNPIRAQLLRKRLHLAPHGILRSAIGHEVLEADQAGHRGQGDNVAAVPVRHLPAERLHRPQMGQHIDVEHLADLSLAVTVQDLAGHDSRIVDQDGDHADLPLYRLAQLKDLFAVRDVAAGMVREGVERMGLIVEEEQF